MKESGELVGNSKKELIILLDYSPNLCFSKKKRKGEGVGWCKNFDFFFWEWEVGWIITGGWLTLSSNWQPIRFFLPISLLTRSSWWVGGLWSHYCAFRTRGKVEQSNVSSATSYIEQTNKYMHCSSDKQKKKCLSIVFSVFHILSMQSIPCKWQILSYCN